MDGIDAHTKLIVSYLVGGRDAEYALAFIDDLRSRLANRVQLTTDGLKAYLVALEESFGADVDYAQLVKLYGAVPESAKGRYSPAECIGTQKVRVGGSPDRGEVPCVSGRERGQRWRPASMLLASLFRSPLPNGEDRASRAGPARRKRFSRRRTPHPAS